MMNEIGSEFWNTEPLSGDTKYLLCGRTALDFIIKDILKTKKANSVMLPSYCCHTMIEPFIANGIKVRFYDVCFDTQKGLYADIPKSEENEIFYYMTYFGFSYLGGIELAKIRKNYSVIIDDRTHSWLSDERNSDCDYYFVSYRKWSGFSGMAKAVKTSGVFGEIPKGTNEKYISMRKKAFELKKQYMEMKTNDKSEFLDLFGKAEELLETDYAGYSTSDECFRELAEFDTEKVKVIRRNNARTLIEGLKNIKEINLIFDTLSKGDTPLFVPIYVGKNRDKLRNFLIENSIYCPVHWPVSEYHNEISERVREIYKGELSIVCDQRYGTEDMLRTVSIIKEFYSKEAYL